jgi:hypothetical protein
MGIIKACFNWLLWTSWYAGVLLGGFCVYGWFVLPSNITDADAVKMKKKLSLTSTMVI